MTKVHQIEKSHLSDRADLELASYRAISPTALLGLVLGFASFAALGHPVLWALPPVAMVVNLLALRRIDHHPTEFTGRNLALAGLMLSLTLGAAAPTRYLTHLEGSRMMARRAIQTWFSRTRSHQLPQALEMMRQPNARMPEDEVDSYYGDEPEGQRAIRALGGDPVVQAVEALGDGARLRYVGTESQQSSPNTEWIKMRFDVVDGDSDNSPLFKLRCALERNAKGSKHEYDWQLKRVEFVEAIPAGVKLPSR